MSVLGDSGTWNELKARLPIGSKATGVVEHVAQFGVFVQLGSGGIGLLRVPDMAGDGPKQMADYPQVGQTVTATVLSYDDGNRQVILSQRA